MDKWPKIRVSKLDAARRQLKCAIELWFADGDPISIHTLACAAHQIIHDVNKLKTGKELLFNSSKIKDEYREFVVSAFKKHMNFFKHADNDPDEIAEFPPVSSEMFIVASMGGLQALGEAWSPTELAFYWWEMLNRPNWFKGSEEILANLMPVQNIAEIKNSNKHEFFQAAIQVFSQGSNIG